MGHTMIDMHNKTVVVTGANSGVGFVTAKRLAAARAEIVMVCRDPERGETARAGIAESATGPAPQLFIADLSSQEEIRGVARDIHFAHDRIDVLLNNAGSVFNKGARSIDGIEKTFATNHLAPFLLTNLLQDLLLAAPAARVVTVATEIYSRKLDFENLQGERSYNFFKAYQQSKLCNVLFAFELARRLDDTSVTSNVVSPGPSKTGFGANMTGPAYTFTRLMKATPRFGAPEKGRGRWYMRQPIPSSRASPVASTTRKRSWPPSPSRATPRSPPTCGRSATKCAASAEVRRRTPPRCRPSWRPGQPADRPT
jgi:NAD(P)-dependent dehydrogenase (short-subunit alcohol dehydrogenase family)